MTDPTLEEQAAFYDLDVIDQLKMLREVVVQPPGIVDATHAIDVAIATIEYLRGDPPPRSRRPVLKAVA